MKTIFKPLGIAAAVAAVTAGYAGAVSAQEVSSRVLGDLAIIPFYTVNSGFTTGVHIVNTTAHTQVVKLRARRGVDSMDSLDFNIVLSPYDEFVGRMEKSGDVSTGGNSKISFIANDTTCAAPAGTATGTGSIEWVMPDSGSEETLINFRNGADEGYIEVIGMAQADSEEAAIAVAAKHVDGVPRDCIAVRSNFFRNTRFEAGSPPVPDLNAKGVISPAMTNQTCVPPAPGGIATGCSAAGVIANNYVDTQSDALKVSWFVRDGNAGLEFGGDAVHIEGFAAAPMMTNQQQILVGDSDPLGFLFPDLDGGSPGTGSRGLYDTVVRPLLGAASIMNEWSSRNNGDFAVTTDWVVTMPGQYLMVNPEVYLLSLELPDAFICSGVDIPATPTTNPITACDFRDIPVGLQITYYDREEGQFTPEEGGLIVSPSYNVTPDGIVLPFEVNVVEWNVNAPRPVLGSDYGVEFAPVFSGGVVEDRGWARLHVIPNTRKTQSVWDYTIDSDPNTPEVDGGPVPVVNKSVPIIGFAVWERAFASNPGSNYGRAIDHSYGSGTGVSSS